MKKFCFKAILAAGLALILTACGSLSVSISQDTQSEKPASSATAATGKLHVHFLDVGQGDSEFLELPDGKTMLIDAGNPENGADIVAYIKKLGYEKIDCLIASHPHSDHIGGMETVVRSLKIGAVYMPRTSEKDTPTTSVYRKLLTAIKEKGLKINTAKAGVTVLSGTVSAVFVAPNGTDYGDLNQYSGVLLLTYGKNRFLFTGDAGNVSEQQIKTDISADVLKVGHHGSATASSAAFLKKVSPKYAVIEVGKDNDYGHPAASTLKRLKSAGAAIYRTDQLGTITFTSDGSTISVDNKPAA